MSAKALPADFVALLGDKHLQFSRDFPHQLALLRTRQRMKLEGIVSKRKASAYELGVGGSNPFGRANQGFQPF